MMQKDCGFQDMIFESEVRMKVSIICATLGPISEVNYLIRSIIQALQKTESSILVEFILVDQSDGFSEPCFPIFDRLHLIHIRNSMKGLSLNRNIGLTRVSGEWVMLLDSDCVVSEDYFKNFVILLHSHSDITHFIGKIIGANSKLPLFRNWPCKAKRLSKWMMWYYATSVNSIFKAGEDKPYFDECFGLGARYGSCEDIDFFLSLKRIRLYSPDLAVFHPEISQKELPREKINSYSFGFGALCAKHAFPLGVLMLLASLIKKFVDMLKGRASLKDFACSLIFRAKGFVCYLGKRVKGGYA
ncbi:MAG TPA: glycosyltransferase family 2 protein [Candidatus Paceibacterota bacterium]|nr:glycosyltransferase family 2 protein [Candidatus Paceibacterota bacterium]